MFLELFYWNMSARFRRVPFFLGSAVIVAYLLAQSLSQYASSAGSPLLTTVAVLGRVRSLTFVLIVLETMGFRAMYGNGAVHILLRSGSRRRFWMSRLLATLALSGLSALLMIVVSLSMDVMVKHVGPWHAGSGAHAPHMVPSSSVAVMFLLLTSGIAAILVLMDVLQILFSSAFLAYVFVTTVQIVSLISHALLTGETAETIFRISPFLRLSLIDNSIQHEQPAHSIEYLLLFLAVESLAGWWLVSYRNIDG